MNPTVSGSLSQSSIRLISVNEFTEEKQNALRVILPVDNSIGKGRQAGCVSISLPVSSSKQC